MPDRPGPGEEASPADGPAVEDAVERARLIEILGPALRTDVSPDGVASKILSIGHSVTSHYSGPIPSPMLLRGFEEVSPGSARLLIEMAVGEQAHRHRMEGRETVFSLSG